MDEGGVVTSQVSQVKCAAYGTHNTYLWVLHLDIIPRGHEEIQPGSSERSEQELWIWESSTLGSEFKSCNG